MVRRFASIPSDFGEGVEHAGLVAVPATLAREGDVLLEVTDDSMDPDLPAGSSVVVDPTVQRPYAGDAVVARIGDRKLLRKVERRGRTVWLVPANRSYGSGERVDDRKDFTIMGAVVGVWRTYGRRRR